MIGVAAFACSSSPGEVVPCSPQDTGGVLCAAVSRGEADFHDHAIAGASGNGRACSDCHMDSDSFQLSPADVETRFQAALATGVDDPLFRPLDADDFDTNGAAASDYSNLRQNGLIRVRLALPANIKLVDPASCLTDGVAAPCDTATTYAVSTATFTDVWRTVPSVFNVKLTGHDSQTAAWPRGPNPQGGYQLDGREDTLQDQALGALQNHAQVTTNPDQGTLDDIAAYETTLLSPPSRRSMSSRPWARPSSTALAATATTDWEWPDPSLRLRIPSLASTTSNRRVPARSIRLRLHAGASRPARPPSSGTTGRTRSRSPMAT